MFFALIVALIGTLMMGELAADNPLLWQHPTSGINSASSGYIYRQNGNAPASVVYLNQGGYLNDAPTVSYPVQYPQYRTAEKPYTAPAISKIFQTAHYNQHQAPGLHRPTVYHSHHPYAIQPLDYKASPPQPQQPLFQPAPKPIAYSAAVSHHNEDNDEEALDDTAAGSYHHHHELKQTAKPDGHHAGHDEHHHKEGGQKHGEEQFHKQGHKGNEAYNKEHEYSKGDKGEHDIAHHEAHYEQDGGHKAHKYDEAHDHGSHAKGEKGVKGGKFGEKKHHKKGSKTTGYHNVFHKDEYKKDHTFYDEADHRGHFDKHGSEHEFHKKDEGDHKAGGHHESGQHEDHYGKKGTTDKGHYDKADEGHKKQHGHEQHFAHAENHGQKGGKQQGSEHKYATHH